VDVGVPVGTAVGVIANVGVLVGKGVCVGVGGAVGVGVGVGVGLQADNTQLKEATPLNLRKSRLDNCIGTDFDFAISALPNP
jgi:hypothetical protein